QGARVLEGPVAEVQRTHTPWDVMLDAGADVSGLATVAASHVDGTATWVRLVPDATMASLLRELADRGRSVRLLREATTSLEDIFVQRVGDSAGAHASAEAAK
ncbi:MAG: hypothetical protein AAF602_27655, partial [Myxococcota bacterium]